MSVCVDATDVWNSFFDFSLVSVFKKTRDLVWNEFGSDIIVIYYLCNS